MSEKKTSKKINVASLKQQALGMLRSLGRYAVVLYLLLLVLVYGFVLYKVNNLSNVQPSDDDLNAQLHAAITPNVDPTAVSQMQTLQDNSVRVQSLFDQARNNPFQE